MAFKIHKDIAVAIISGIFGLIGGLITHLPEVEGVLFQLNFGARMEQVSESPPSDEWCSSKSDLGRLVLHSRGEKRGIFFCAQGAAPNYDKPIWYVADGVPASQYMK